MSKVWSAQVMRATNAVFEVKNLFKNQSVISRGTRRLVGAFIENKSYPQQRNTTEKNATFLVSRALSAS
jgi:hypothetical protein